MLNKDAVARFVSEATLWWAGNWQSPLSVKQRRIAPMVANGSVRFDDLIASYAMQIWDWYDLAKWQKLLQCLAALSLDLQSQIFQSRADALNGAVNTTATVVQDAGYSLRGNRTWGAFYQEYADLLADEADVHELTKCLAEYFSHH